jgi:hypothetical protein
MKLPVYRRIGLLRTVVIIVALFLTAASTRGVAREFRAADIIEQNRIGVTKINRIGVTKINRNDATLIKAQGDPAVAQLIERIRKVE